MARIRTIKPEFFLHDELAELSPLHRLLFIGLWTLADSEGRLGDNPKRIKAALLPWDQCDIDAILADLEHHGFIQRYEVAGSACISIPTFLKHQRPHPKERPLGLPNPPEPEKNTASREKKRLAITNPPSIPSSPAGKGREGDLGVGKEFLDSPPAAVESPAGQLRERLDAAFAKAREGAAYDWGGINSADEQALGVILAKPGVNDAEVLRRWSIGLGLTHPPLNSITALSKRWNDCAAPQKAATGPPATDATPRPKPMPHIPEFFRPPEQKCS